MLYDTLLRLADTPVVRLNRAVAIAFADSPEAGLREVEAIGGLEGYHLWHAARAQLLKRLGRRAEAQAAFQRALSLTENRVEREFLSRQMRA